MVQDDSLKNPIKCLLLGKAKRSKAIRFLRFGMEVKIINLVYFTLLLLRPDYFFYRVCHGFRLTKRDYYF